MDQICFVYNVIAISCRLVLFLSYLDILFYNNTYNFSKNLLFINYSIPKWNEREFFILKIKTFMIFFLFTLVVKAAHTFYNGSTSISVKTGDSTPRKRKTERLNTVVCPEEKRKIIGDTFMRVLNTE